MNRLLWIFLAVMYSFSSALIYCDDIDPYIQQGFSKDEIISAIKSDRKAHFANECYIEGGLGSDYGYDGGWVPDCGDLTGSKNGYVKSKVSCDFCSANWVKQELKDLENVCREDCRTSNFICKPTDIATLWGGEIKKINPSGGSCGSPLPNCSVSSSSEIVESSSSELVESSNSEDPESSSSEDEEYESSSSYAISSSSEEDVESSSSEDEIDSSSSEDDDDESSSSSEDYGNIFPCYVPNDDGGCSVDVYVSRSPMPMIEALKFVPNSRDEVFSSFSYENGEGYISIRSNIPSQKKGYWKPCYYDKNNCKRVGDELPPKAEGELYYCYGGAWGESTPMGCTSSNGVSVSITENLKLERVHGSFFAPINVTDEQVLEIANEAARLRADAPFFCVENGKDVEIGWITFGKDKNRTIEDVFDYIRPYFDKCRERLQSSSSQISSSSSSAKSSSSNVKSSSSSKTIEISSSSIEDKSSSSVNIESSSSDFVYSSSDDGVFVAGGDQEYTSDQIFKDGLDNMEDGKCYSLNPARGTQHGWMNTNAQDSWWWREVDCETGDKVDNNRVGACPGFPLDNVPSNPKNACFAYNGTCYKCNPARGSECSNSWLWQGTFTSANVGWWYEKVDCYDPFGEEDEGEFVENKQYACLVENKHTALHKLTGNASNLAKNNIKDQYGIVFSMLSVNKYDVLGRNRINYNNNYIKKHSFNRFLPINREYGEIIILKKDGGEIDALVELKSLKETVRVYTKGPLKGYAFPDKNGNLIYYISAQIFVTILNADYGNNDPRLVSHEKEHERIFNTINKKRFSLTVLINKDLDNDKTCQEKKEAIWNAAKSTIRNMYDQQVDWDNNDPNNISNHRIDVNQAMKDVEKHFKDAYYCGCN